MTELQQKEIQETQETIQKLINQRNHLTTLHRSAITHNAPQHSINSVRLQLDAIQKQVDQEIEYLEYLAEQVEQNLAESV